MEITTNFDQLNTDLDALKAACDRIKEDLKSPDILVWRGAVAACWGLQDYLAVVQNDALHSISVRQ